MRGTFILTLVFLATVVVLWALNWYLLSQLWQGGDTGLAHQFRQRFPLESGAVHDCGLRVVLLENLTNGGPETFADDDTDAVVHRSVRAK